MEPGWKLLILLMIASIVAIFTIVMIDRSSTTSHISTVSPVDPTPTITNNNQKLVKWTGNGTFVVDDTQDNSYSLMNVGHKTIQLPRELEHTYQFATGSNFHFGYMSRLAVGCPASITAMVSDDKYVYVAGNILLVDNIPHWLIARFSIKSGLCDHSWQAMGYLLTENPATQFISSMILVDQTLYVSGVDLAALGGKSVRGVGAISTLTTQELDALTTEQRLALPSSTFNALVRTGDVLAMRYDGGNFLYLAGDFTTIGGSINVRNGVIVSSSSSPATIDVKFDCSPLKNLTQNNSSVNAVAEDERNKWIYYGGEFTILGTAFVNNVGRVSSIDGQVDRNWFPNGVYGVVSALALDEPNGLLYIGGLFTCSENAGLGSSDQTYQNLIRVSTVTGLVDDWRPCPNGAVRALALDVARNAIYAGGAFTQIGLSVATSPPTTGDNPIEPGQSTTRICRLKTNTKYNLVDTAFAGSAGALVRCLLLDAANSVLYVGGDFTSVTGSTTRNRLAALNMNTGSATTWDPNIYAASGCYVSAIVLEGSTLYVGGSFTAVGAALASRVGLAAFSTSGTTNVHTSFAPGVSRNVFGLALDISKTPKLLYAVGDFTEVNTTITRTYAAAFRLDQNTSNVTDWNLSILSAVTLNCVYLDKSKRIHIGTSGNADMGVEPSNGCSYLARVNIKTGAVDPSFKFTLDAIVYDVELDMENKYAYIGGNFKSINGIYNHHLARINLVDLSVDYTWKHNINGLVRCIKIIGDYIYIGGQFGQVYNQLRTLVARFRRSSLLSPPALDMDWHPRINTGLQTWLYDVWFNGVGGDDIKYPTPVVQCISAVNEGKDVVLAGAFMTVNGRPRYHVCVYSTETDTLRPWCISSIYFAGDQGFVGSRTPVTSLTTQANDSGIVYLGYTQDRNIAGGINASPSMINNQFGQSAFRLFVGATLYAPPTIDGTSRTFINTGTDKLPLQSSGTYTVQPYSDNQWSVDFRPGVFVTDA